MRLPVGLMKGGGEGDLVIDEGRGAGQHETGERAKGSDGQEDQGGKLVNLNNNILRCPPHQGQGQGQGFSPPGSVIHSSGIWVPGGSSSHSNSQLYLSQSQYEDYPPPPASQPSSSSSASSEGIFSDMGGFSSRGAHASGYGQGHGQEGIQEGVSVQDIISNSPFTPEQVDMLCDVMLQEEKFHMLRDFLSRLSKVHESENVLRARARLAFEDRQTSVVYSVLESRHFHPKYHRELQELYNKAKYLDEERKRGKEALGAVDKYRVRKKFKLPLTIWDGEEMQYMFKRSVTQILKDTFKMNPYPNAEIKKELGKRLGLTKKQIDNWFKNRRQRANKDGKSPHPHQPSKPMSPIKGKAKKGKIETDGYYHPPYSSPLLPMEGMELKYTPTPPMPSPPTPSTTPLLLSSQTKPGNGRGRKRKVSATEVHPSSSSSGWGKREMDEYPGILNPHGHTPHHPHSHPSLSTAWGPWGHNVGMGEAEGYCSSMILPSIAASFSHSHSHAHAHPHLSNFQQETRIPMNVQ